MNEMLQVRYFMQSGSRVSRTNDRNAPPIGRAACAKALGACGKEKAGELAFSGLSALVG
jgi:hypothetical protein